MKFEELENLNTSELIELYDDILETKIAVYRCVIGVNDIKSGECVGCAFGGGYTESQCSNVCEQIRICCSPGWIHNHWDQTDYCYYQQNIEKPVMR